MRGLTPPGARTLDLAAYDIRLFTLGGSLAAQVTELPGCVAGAKTVVELQAKIEQAMYIYLDDHPDAPRHYR